MRIPPFWTEEPELWFAQIEGQFALGSIIGDEAKFAHILSRIEPKQAREIKDVIIHPPKHNKYKMIKKTDIEAYRLTRTANPTIIGTRRIRRPKAIAIPPPLKHAARHKRSQRIIANTVVRTTATAHADHFGNKKRRQIGRRSRTGGPYPRSQQQDTRDGNKGTKHRRGSNNGRQVTALTMQMEKMAKNMQRERRRNRTRSHLQRRPRPKSRNRTPVQERVYFYHRIFGTEVRKCTKPCTYKTENKQAGY